jgi:hypothetical protein
MIITKFVDITMGYWNLKYYKSIGFDVSFGDIINIEINMLPAGSHVKIEMRCDYCGEKFFKEYRAILKSKENNFTQKDSCRKCIGEKCKETNLTLYGFENPMGRQEVKDTIKNTVMERYGVEYASQVQEFKDKQRQTVSGKTENDKSAIVEKRRKTTFELYGVDNYAKTEDCKDKIKLTSLEKYGYESPALHPSVREKYRQTILKQYGADNYFGTSVFKDYLKSYWQEKCGVSHVSQTEEHKNKVSLFWENIDEDTLRNIQKKRMDTLFERYGEIYPVDAYDKNCVLINGQKISKPQLKVFEIIKDFYGTENSYLNYCDDIPYWLDILLTYNNAKIDIEYDCFYWHNSKRDSKRDCFMLSLGFYILRIKSGNKIPTLEQLNHKIYEMVENKIYYSEIILDDWNQKLYEKEVISECMSNNSI